MTIKSALTTTSPGTIPYQVTVPRYAWHGTYFPALIHGHQIRIRFPAWASHGMPLLIHLPQRLTAPKSTTTGTLEVMIPPGIEPNDPFVQIVHGRKTAFNCPIISTSGMRILFPLAECKRVTQEHWNDVVYGITQHDRSYNYVPPKEISASDVHNECVDDHIMEKVEEVPKLETRIPTQQRNEISQTLKDKLADALHSPHHEPIKHEHQSEPFVEPVSFAPILTKISHLERISCKMKEIMFTMMTTVICITFGIMHYFYVPDLVRSQSVRRMKHCVPWFEDDQHYSTTFTITA